MSTYTPIASVTLSSAQSSVTFSGIPQTYTDLVLVFAGSMTSSARVDIRVGNGTLDTGSNYSNTQLNGNGSSAASQRYTSSTTMQGMFDAVGTGTGQVVSITNFQNYTNTTTNKTVLGRSNSASNGTSAYVGLWRSTAAINTISLIPTSDFAAGSTFNLYGVANASITNVAKATGGDTVVTDGTYWYHVFRSSGTFTPTQALTADCLVIAGGGGGGGGYAGGGGGAGGLQAFTSQALSTTAYTVTIGAGGAGSTGHTVTSSSGANSQFGALTASVGGGGGGTTGSGVNTGKNGGSGGGSSEGAAVGTGTSGQGNDGGTSIAQFANGRAGGGGGKNAAGGNAGATSAGSGGAGSSTYSSWGSATSTGQNSGGTYYYAGGGGAGCEAPGTNTAGTGGLGGGGNGNNNGAGTAAISNTGGGGGGAGAASGTGGGGNGGSGIVIVRYAA